MLFMKKSWNHACKEFNLLSDSRVSILCFNWLFSWLLASNLEQSYNNNNIVSFTSRQDVLNSTNTAPKSHSKQLTMHNFNQQNVNTKNLGLLVLELGLNLLRYKIFVSDLSFNFLSWFLTLYSKLATIQFQEYDTYSQCFDAVGWAAGRSFGL